TIKTAPAGLLCIRATQPINQNPAHGSSSTTPVQAINRPLVERTACRVAGSACHQEIPATITANSTNPVAIFPPMLFRKSISVVNCSDLAGLCSYKPWLFPKMGGVGKSETRNQKPEIRKNAQNPKPEMRTASLFWVSGFGHSFGFRVSGFGFPGSRFLVPLEVHCTS